MNDNVPLKTTPPKDHLRDSRGCLLEVFGENPPSERWFAQQVKRGLIPHFRIGRLVRFSPVLVRAALELHCLIEAKNVRRARKATEPEASA